MTNTAQANHNKLNTALEVIESNKALQYSLLIGITLLAGVLRFYKVKEWGFWIDEIYTINNAVGDLSSLLIPVSTRLISIALGGMGIDEFSARLVPVLLGIITIPIFFFPIRKLTGGITALLAALLLALAPWHIYWSQNARFYTALMLFYGLAGLFWLIWLESEKTWYLILSMLLIGFAMLERGTTLFIFPVLVVYVVSLLYLPFEKPPGLSWRNLALFFTPMIILGGLVIFTTGNFTSFFTKILGHQHNPIRVTLSVIYDLGLPLFILAIIGGAYLIYQKNRLGLFLVVGVLIPLIILVLIAPFTQAFSRYLFQTLPFWVMLGAMAIKALIDNAAGKGKYLALGIALLLVADAFSQDFLYFNFQNGNREDFRGAFEVIAGEKQPDDMVVSGWPEIGSYYLDEPVISSFEANVEDIASGDNRVWFVVDNRSGFPGQLQSWLEMNSRLIAVRDVYIPGKVMLMRVYLYHPENAGLD